MSFHFATRSNTSINRKASDDGQKRYGIQSSLKRKSVSSITSNGLLAAGSDSSDTSQQRRAHFDQSNIDMTYKPIHKDYGYIQIKQAATPFPRRSSTMRFSVTEKRKSNEFTEETKKLIDPLLPRDFSIIALRSGDEATDFVTKRQLFCKGEFTITRQRRSMQVHPPLTKIDEAASVRKSSSNFNLTKFFRKHYQQRDSPIFD
ncbi:uncharacterized protein [Bactrocera oleae]|uniref:uncharacterized protein n=1 Tax=Bactrocera oleae TaxID=104688 RepID=UPI00174AAB6E|nr:uncharacterized protein LOC118680657 [Bactrocera oleae]